MMLAERSKPDKGLRVIDGEKKGRIGARSPEPATREPGAEPQSGDLIAGKYEIRRMIAQGGVGIVYLAHRVGAEEDESTPREVVIKLLAKRWLTDSDAVARFEREANRLRSLEHPNVVSMLDYGVDNGRPYLVMEYIEGESLADYLASRSRLTLREFVPIAAQVLKGMGHAHSRKMMIRDVKPSNIMLCQRKGRANFVKILDFGLAKFLEDESPLTEGYVLGTAGYLAPEALRGEPLDLRVDVYSIGVLFYQLLSGELPFEADTTEAIFYKTLNEKPIDLRQRLQSGHDVPDGLITLIEQCLEKDPNARPEDSNLIVEQLIDVVPAAMFRLPLIGARGPAGAPLGAGNTGLIQLVGMNPSIQRPLATLPETASSKRVRVIAWGSAYGLTLLVAALVVYASVFRHDRAEPVAQAVAPVSSLDAAAPPAPAPAPAAPQVPSEPAMAASSAAVPTPVEATPSEPVRTTTVFLASFPEARVIVDGRDQGSTPFKQPLALGRHTFSISAPGYKEWTSTVDVTATELEPITVHLERLRAPARGRAPSRAGANAQDASSADARGPAEPPPSTSERSSAEPREREDVRPSVFLSAQPPKKKVRAQPSLLVPQ